MTGKKHDKRLRDEDAALWRQVAEGLKPLQRRAERATPTSPPTQTEEAAAPPAPTRKPRPAAPARRAEPQAQPPAPAPRPLQPGSLVDIDKRTAERLKRGKLAVEARLDLHGMTQAQAERALARFLAESQDAGRRTVLLITGKGRGGALGGDGVLRREVPRWLNQPRNRERVVAASPAQPRDGGEGALYLRLRRKRES